MTNKRQKDAWKRDSNYIAYIERGESAAVYLVRDIVKDKAINTKGKWIDVLSVSSYKKYTTNNRRGFAFNWIIVELFSRHLQPQYDPYDSAHNKYLTWLTAHEDIDNQRKAGYHGEKYLVLCRLCNKNQNKPVEPECTYEIQSVRKVNKKQVQYIQNNHANLEVKIKQKGKPTLEILGLQ